MHIDRNRMRVDTWDVEPAWRCLVPKWAPHATTALLPPRLQVVSVGPGITSRDGKIIPVNVKVCIFVCGGGASVDG